MNPITVLRSATNMVWNATVSQAQRATPPPAAPQGLAAIPDTAKPATPLASKPFFLIRWFSWLWSFVPSMPWKRQPAPVPASAPNLAPQPAPPQNPVVDHKPRMLQMLQARLAAGPSREVLQAYEELGVRIRNGSITSDELEEAFANIDQAQKTSVRKPFKGQFWRLMRELNPEEESYRAGQEERVLMLEMLDRKTQRELPDETRERYEALRPRIANGTIDLDELEDEFTRIDREGHLVRVQIDPRISLEERVHQEALRIQANLQDPEYQALLRDPAMIFHEGWAPTRTSLEERGQVLVELDNRLRQQRLPEVFACRYREVAQPICDEKRRTTGMNRLMEQLEPIDRDLVQYLNHPMRGFFLKQIKDALGRFVEGRRG